ncbi:hypothetical protein R6Q59_009087 [Mikania micrantha]
MVAMSRDPLGSTQPLSSESSVWKTTTSEIEEIEPGHNGSPLHWLMGYAYQSKCFTNRFFLPNRFGFGTGLVWKLT